MTITGSLHPISLYLRQAIAVFHGLGFEVLDSPEIVTERNNFDDLLIPPTHPARSMHDTFWLIDGRLPRTHTSAFQIPAMKDRTPPVRFVVPGRAFRNEATDATHEIMFVNFEGVAIGEDVSLAHLKGTIQAFLQALNGADTEVKFVPSYFPFVEPGLEVYAKVRDRWIEMGGAGMIHPGVLKNMSVDQQKFQGFAFGFGIDRLVLLKYGIEDIRLLYSGNLRFLQQFVVHESTDEVLSPAPARKSIRRGSAPVAQAPDSFWDGVR